MRNRNRKSKKGGPWFEGWYFKCRTKDGRAIALIPAFHIDAENRRSASLQIIADSGTWWLDYPAEAFNPGQDGLCIRMGQNVFSGEGLDLCIERPGISLSGRVNFGPFLRLRSHIMGPFQFLGEMECSHGVISMAHSLEGTLMLNGETMDFDGGRGYIETDRGRSFPQSYLWAQGSFPGGELMLAIAEIPLGGIRFTGCICALVLEGREYRLATYRGVRVERWSEQGAVIRQGRYRLELTVSEQRPQLLRAPNDGKMERRIHESLCTGVHCRFLHGGTLLFDGTDRGGSFEFCGGGKTK